MSHAIASTVMLTPHRLAELLDAARRRRRMTQAQAAALIGVSPDTFGTWERGERYPRGVHVRRRIEWFLGGSVRWACRDAGGTLVAQAAPHGSPPSTRRRSVRVHAGG